MPKKKKQQEGQRKEKLAKQERKNGVALPEVAAVNGNNAMSRAVPTATEFKQSSDISSGLRHRKRSKNLKAVDTELAAFEGLTGTSPETRIAKLGDIESKIAEWQKGKGGGDTSKTTKRGTHVSGLLDKVQDAKKDAMQEVKRARVQAYDPALLEDLPADAAEAGQELFDRFMASFRAEQVRYTLRAVKESPWQGGKGPFACASFAIALAELAQSAGLTARQVQVKPINFVTPNIHPGFIDPGAEGNLRMAGGRVPNYFFTKHYVTQIGNDFYCPTSGKALSGIEAKELVDPEIGQLREVHKGELYEGDGITVQRDMTRFDADGSSLYDLTFAE